MRRLRLKRFFQRRRPPLMMIRHHNIRHLTQPRPQMRYHTPLKQPLQMPRRNQPKKPRPRLPRWRLKL
jgi:hypothetical protein